MKKIWVSLLIIFIIISLFAISKTYSYYVEKYDNDVKFELAKWVIKVNNSDITSNNSQEFTINNYVYDSLDGSSVSKSNNKFAPGMKATFEIEIDATKVDVSFDYYLNIDISDIDNDNIVIYNVTNNLNNIELEDGLYHGFYDVKSSNKKDVINVTIGWLDTEVNNDFEFIQNFDGTLLIPVTINLRQREE